MAKSILGVGSPLLDILSGVEDSFLSAEVSGAKGGMENLPPDALDRLVGKLPHVRKAPGGAAGNTVFGLARLGQKAAMFGKTGDDEYGTFYRERFVRGGGDGSAFAVDRETPTGRCVSMVTPDNERTMRTYLGASLNLSPDDVAKVDFSRYDVVYIEGYMLYNQPMLLRLLAAAREAGCEIALDLASFEVVRTFKPQIEQWIDGYLDMVFANEDEAAELLGEMPEDRMAETLSRRCGIAAVKVGRRGAFIGRNGDVVQIAADPAPDAIDTTGAGDLWTTGFFYGYLNGLPLERCGRFGSIVAREVVRVLGADIPDDRWAVIRREIGIY